MLTKEEVERLKSEKKRVRKEAAVFLKENKPNYYTYEEVAKAISSDKDIVMDALMRLSVTPFGHVQSIQLAEKSGGFEYYYTYR